jgi:hypothetical protein
MATLPAPGDCAIETTRPTPRTWPLSFAPPPSATTLEFAAADNDRLLDRIEEGLRDGGEVVIRHHSGQGSVRVVEDIGGGKVRVWLR